MDKMIGEEAALAMIFSGDALYAQGENPDLEYAVPKEGTEFWIDAWAIPKNAKNKENAEAFINFMCRPDVAYTNFEYLGYSTPNVTAWEIIEEEDPESYENEILFPPEEVYEICETPKYLGAEADEKYNALWRELKAE